MAENVTVRVVEDTLWDTTVKRPFVAVVAVVSKEATHTTPLVTEAVAVQLRAESVQDTCPLLHDTRAAELSLQTPLLAVSDANLNGQVPVLRDISSMPCPAPPVGIIAQVWSVVEADAHSNPPVSTVMQQRTLAPKCPDSRTAISPFSIPFVLAPTPK